MGAGLFRWGGRGMARGGLLFADVVHRESLRITQAYVAFSVHTWRGCCGNAAALLNILLLETQQPVNEHLRLLRGAGKTRFPTRCRGPRILRNENCKNGVFWASNAAFAAPKRPRFCAPQRIRHAALYSHGLAPKHTKLQAKKLPGMPLFTQNVAFLLLLRGLETAEAPAEPGEARPHTTEGPPWHFLPAPEP
jgi:hypothetical protein